MAIYAPLLIQWSAKKHQEPWISELGGRLITWILPGQKQWLECMKQFVMLVQKRRLSESSRSAYARWKIKFIRRDNNCIMSNVCWLPEFWKRFHGQHVTHSCKLWRFYHILNYWVLLNNKHHFPERMRALSSRGVRESFYRQQGILRKGRLAFFPTFPRVVDGAAANRFQYFWRFICGN